MRILIRICFCTGLIEILKKNLYAPSLIYLYLHLKKFLPKVVFFFLKKSIKTNIQNHSMGLGFIKIILKFNLVKNYFFSFCFNCSQTMLCSAAKLKRKRKNLVCRSLMKLQCISLSLVLCEFWTKLQLRTNETYF